MIYNKIYDFCKVRNKGNCFSNGEQPTPRVKFLMELLDSEGIEYELDVFERDEPEYDYPRPRPRFEDMDRIRRFRQYMYDEYYEKEEEVEKVKPKNKYFNLILRGSSDKMIVAHHDVNNHTTDNANDNSCSVINLIATKKLKPSVHAVILDGEEFGGIGSQRLSEQIKSGDFGEIKWVLNFELTGKGGKYFFIGDYPGPLSTLIKSIFNCPVVKTPFNDSVILRRNGIDSTVINPVPPMEGGKTSTVVFSDGTYLDTSILYNCHSPKDTVSTISPDEMREFVEEVVLKILK